MKILWVKSDFLHPTNRGGQIRTLETLKRLHARHEVHYIAYDNPAQPEGVRRAPEYCSFAYPVQHSVPPRASAAFVKQLLGSVFSPMPLGLSRYTSDAMRKQIAGTMAAHSFDSIVCDFLFPAPNFANFSRCVLFQHNVETMIWRRHSEHAPDPLRKYYFHLQAQRMFEWESRACREAASVIAVSDVDANLMKEMFGISRVTYVPTGVDVTYFRRPEQVETKADLVFVGSMDWMPNTDGVQWFADEILPLIHRKKPDCKVAIVGRTPSASTLALAEKDQRIQVTGTVPDVRPWLWGSAVSIVPLRIGGGTRLKIYESMAAGTAVVSTTVGAEGLDVSHPSNIRLADTPSAFAEACLSLLNDKAERDRMASEAFELVASRYSWDKITDQFESVLTASAVTA